MFRINAIFMPSILKKLGGRIVLGLSIILYIKLFCKQDIWKTIWARALKLGELIENNE